MSQIIQQINTFGTDDKFVPGLVTQKSKLRHQGRPPFP